MVYIFSVLISVFSLSALADTPTYLPDLVGVSLESVAAKADFHLSAGSLSNCTQKNIADQRIYTCDVENSTATFTSNESTRSIEFQKVFVWFKHIAGEGFVNDYSLIGIWKTELGGAEFKYPTQLYLQHPRGDNSHITGQLQIRDLKVNYPVLAVPE